MTLWDSYEQSLKNGTGVKCKKKDVMNLRAITFKSKRDTLIDGFIEAARFLVKQGVYAPDNLPYNTQFIPLAAIFAYDISHKKVLTNLTNLTKLSRWYWCGVFGELYGSANETRYALDIKELFAWIEDDNVIPDTVSRSSFSATRLLTLQTRNSAAYKGVMALLLKEEPLDFMTAGKMSVATYMQESTDIHHIFPVSHCEKEKLPREKWNSVINKTIIYASTNRSIGGDAPSKYIKALLNHKISQNDLELAVASHQIDFNLLDSDDFDGFIIDRAKKLLNLIEKSTGKSTSGRGTKETIDAFGASSNFNLCSANNPNYIDAISKNSLPFVMHGRDLFYMPAVVIGIPRRVSFDDISTVQKQSCLSKRLDNRRENPLRIFILSRFSSHYRYRCFQKLDFLLFFLTNRSNHHYLLYHQLRHCLYRKMGNCRFL